MATSRLTKVAREFNVGMQTLVEFLAKKGHQVEMNPNTKISEEQYDLLETIESEDCTPSLSQAQRMKQFSEGGHLSMDAIFRIMSEPKPNQREKIVFRYDDLRRFFPNHSMKEIHDTILRLIESEFQRQQRARRDRDAR